MVQQRRVTTITVSPLTARGDTFDFAEDEDYDDVFQGTTQSPRRSAQSLTPVDRQLGATPDPIPDFNQRPQQRPDSTLEMAKPPRLSDTIFQRVPFRQKPPTAPPTPSDPTTVEPLEMDTAAETTTAAVTTATAAATTEAPDPDAEVCSGRPFDSFMQLKNGSIYAFRGE